MTAPATIEPVRPDDAGTLRDFMTRVIEHSVTREPALRDELVANVQANLELWLADPAPHCHLKAVQGGQLVGVVLVKAHWNLCSLFVEPDRQGRGIGRALVEAALDACRRQPVPQPVRLNAAPGAVGFYRTLGFRPTTARRPLPEGFEAMERCP